MSGLPPDRLVALANEHRAAAAALAAALGAPGRGLLAAPASPARYWLAFGRARGIERAAELLDVDLGVARIDAQADALRAGGR